MSDLISRKAAIDALMAWEEDSVWDEECLKHRGEPYWVAPSDVVEELPSAQPERLTDDDFETIRIHLNAYKENLCNQRRWKEAEEYQRIIDRFIAFVSVQPERRWIPCSERLPEIRQNVLLCDDLWYFIAEYYGDHWYIDGVFKNSEDLDYDGFAWMPLPRPYREGT